MLAGTKFPEVIFSGQVGGYGSDQKKLNPCFSNIYIYIYIYIYRERERENRKWGEVVSGTTFKGGSKMLFFLSLRC
jgi:hypothetical protein